MRQAFPIEHLLVPVHFEFLASCLSSNYNQNQIGRGKVQIKDKILDLSKKNEVQTCWIETHDEGKQVTKNTK